MVDACELSCVLYFLERYVPKYRGHTLGTLEYIYMQNNFVYVDGTYQCIPPHLHPTCHTQQSMSLNILTKAHNICLPEKVQAL
jgi:hypothetical protein